MFEFNLSLSAYISIILIALSVVGGVFFLELKLCDVNDPGRLKKTILLVCRQYLQALIVLIALILFSWLIFSIVGTPRAVSDIDWSVGDSLFLLLITPIGWMSVHLQSAAENIAMKKDKQSSK